MGGGRVDGPTSSTNWAVPWMLVILLTRNGLAPNPHPRAVDVVAILNEVDTAYNHTLGNQMSAVHSG